MIWMHVGDSPDTLTHIIDWERQLEMCLHLAGFESGVLRDKGAGSHQAAAANTAHRHYNLPKGVTHGMLLLKSKAPQLPHSTQPLALKLT